MEEPVQFQAFAIQNISMVFGLNACEIAITWQHLHKTTSRSHFKKPSNVKVGERILYLSLKFISMDSKWWHAKRSHQQWHQILLHSSSSLTRKPLKRAATGFLPYRKKNWNNQQINTKFVQVEEHYFGFFNTINSKTWGICVYTLAMKSTVMFIVNQINNLINWNNTQTEKMNSVSCNGKSFFTHHLSPQSTGQGYQKYHILVLNCECERM